MTISAATANPISYRLPIPVALPRSSNTQTGSLQGVRHAGRSHHAHGPSPSGVSSPVSLPGQPDASTPPGSLLDTLI